MSIDQDLFQGLSEALQKSVGPSEETINYVAYVRSYDDWTKTYWLGDKKSAKSNFVVNDKGIKNAIDNITLALYRFYRESDLANWNVMEFKVMSKERRFNVVFEFSEDLQEGVIDFYDYCEKYR